MGRTLALTIAFLAVSPGVAQQIGDTVVGVAENNAELVSGRTVVGNVDEGNLLRVEGVAEDWLLVRSKGIRGYIRTSDVMTVDRALDHFTKQISTNPRAAGYDARGVIWGTKGEFGKALDDFNEAIRLDRRLTSAYVNRGLTRAFMGEYDKAAADFDAAVRIDPEYDRAQSTIGWFLASCPEEKYRNGRRAVEHAKKACELTAWRCEFSIEALAAALAEAGRFELAVEWQRVAVKRRPGDEKEGRSRLSLYESGKPYRLKEEIRTANLDTQ